MTTDELRDEVEGHALFLEAAGAVAAVVRGHRPAAQEKAFGLLKAALDGMLDPEINSTEGWVGDE